MAYRMEKCVLLILANIMPRPMILLFRCDASRRGDVQIVSLAVHGMHSDVKIGFDKNSGAYSHVGTSYVLHVFVKVGII